MRRLAGPVFLCAAVVQHTSVAYGMRLLCTATTSYAPKRLLSATGKGNAATPSAFSRSGSGSSNSRGGAAALKGNSTTTASTVAGTVPDFAASTISFEEGEEEAERRLMEGDTRLAMRLLMQRHFLYQNNVRRPEERRLEEERENLRRKHQARMERIEEKTRNSKRLGSDVAVDGILPLYRHSKVKGAATAAAGVGVGVGAMSGSAGSWMRLNPVEADSSGMTDSDDCIDGVGGGSMDIHANALLMKPDISAYDSEHDQRICSSDVLNEEEKRRQGELQGSETAGRLLSTEELDIDGGLTPQRVIQSQLLQDEDQDFAVEAYFNDNDE